MTPAKRSKKIILVRNARQNTEASRRKLIEAADKLHSALGDDYEVKAAMLHDFVYDAQADGHSAIWHYKEGWDIATSELVIINRVGDDIELGIALANYLRSKGVHFMDQYLLSPGKGKLAGAFLWSREQLPIIRTVYAHPAVLLELFSKNPPFQFPCILKADKGKKGKDNYLIKNFEDFSRVLTASDQPMIVQPFIENQGDFRVLVLNGTPELVIERKRSESTHLNNVSQGGSARKIPLQSVDQRLLADAVLSAKLEKLAIAGIDIMIDEKSKKHVLLEINRSPQVFSGSFIEDKLEALANTVKSIVK